MLRSIAVAAFILLLPSGAAYAQPVPYETVDDRDMVSLMNRVEVLGDVSNDTLAVRVLRVGNEAGSAGSRSSEITYSVYIAVSEYDIVPEQNLFTFADLYNPELHVPESEKTDNESLVLHLRFGPAKARRSIRIEPSLTSLHVEDMRP